MSSISGLHNLNNLNSVSNSVASSIKKISTGSKYPSASYGASAYAISVKNYSNIDTAYQSRANTQTSNSMLKVAEGAASNTVSSLSTLKSQLINAANGTNTSGDVANLTKSMNAAISSIDENAQVEYNGMKLLDGSKSIHVASENGYSNINLGNLTSQALGLTDKDGNSTLDLSSPDGIKSAIETVDKALGMSVDAQDNIGSALDQITGIGAAQQGLSADESNYTTYIENATAAESVNGDVDIATEATKLKSGEAQQQMAMFAAKMYMHQNASVLSLLK